MPITSHFPALRNPSARRNKAEWSDVVKQWDQYKTCANTRISKGKQFYHPSGSRFHRLATSQCGWGEGKVDCSPTGEGCNDKWNQFKAKLDEFNRVSPSSYTVVVADFPFNVDTKSVLNKVNSGVPSDTPPVEDVPVDDMPSDDGVAQTHEDVLDVEGDTTSTETSSPLPLILGGLTALLVVGGAAYVIKKRRLAV